MQIIEDSTFGFSSPYWTNDELLNEDTAITDEVNAKYAAFLNVPFQAIRMCVGNYQSNCVTYTFDDTWSSAKDLFNAGYIRDSSLNQARILEVYGPEAGSYQVSYQELHKP